MAVDIGISDNSLYITSLISGSIMEKCTRLFASCIHNKDTKDPESRADKLLSQEIKEKWTREQDDLKKKLNLTDTPDLKQMLALDTHQDADEEKQTCGRFYVGGMDISFVKGDDVNACAALVVLTYPKLELVYEDYQMIKLTEPYIPGFLAFREVPFIVKMFENLRSRKPDLVPSLLLVDGNGILHPRGFGSACHLGVTLGIPCVGVAKKLFHVDGLEKDLQHQDKIKHLTNGGDTFPLIGNSTTILGMALRSCSNTQNPVYVSPGHLITMETAVRLVHKCCKNRVPEPIRMADIKSREYLRRLKESDKSNTKKQKQRGLKNTMMSKRGYYANYAKIISDICMVCLFLIKRSS